MKRIVICSKPQRNDTVAYDFFTVEAVSNRFDDYTIRFSAILKVASSLPEPIKSMERTIFTSIFYGVELPMTPSIEE